MRSSLASFTFLISALGSTTVAAMSAHSGPLGHCHVVGGDKLPAASGGSAALCAELERAAAKMAPGVAYSAEIKVLSKSRLSASLVVNGRALSDQHFAIMDSELNAGAIQRFAASLGDAIAGGARAPK
jgi:hypothetical protein